MAKAYGDDLRRKILEAYGRKEGTIAQTAARFGVSFGYVDKILGQYRRTGKMERIPHRPGRKPLLTPPIREQLRVWLKNQPDLTLAELQEKLRQGAQLRVSLPSLWVVLRKMGLRLKKSRSMRRSKTRRGSSRAASLSPENKRDRRVAMGVCGRNLVQHPDEPLLGMGREGGKNSGSYPRRPLA
jgi:transposase